MADAHFIGDRPIYLVGMGDRRVGHHPEHFFSLIVIGRQLVTPVGDMTPLAVGVEGIQRAVERVRVNHRSTADGCAGKNQNAAEHGNFLKSVATY